MSSMMIDKFLCRLRGVAFWNIDKIKGGLVKSAYDEIRLIDELDSNDDFIKVHQQRQLENLIEHAVQTTQFYNRFDKNTQLCDLPITNKNLIRDNQDEFISNEFKINELYKMCTSGSTGIPFISYQDYGKKRKVNAENIYYSEKAGYSVGKNLIYLRAVTDKNRKSRFLQWVQNESLIDISGLDDGKINSILLDINRASKNGSIILAYASTFDAFKDYFSREHSRLPSKATITGMISGSEMLFDNTRNSMKQTFNCAVLSRYSNQENGIIGQDEKEKNVFILNEANYIVEIFDLEKDEEVPEGGIGRIVITDLYNMAMPMIRYDTGDIGSITRVESHGKLKKAINNFGGRKVDMVFDSFGNRLSPHIISNNFWGFSEIKQFQFIQKSSDAYVVKINTDVNFQQTDAVKRMLEKLLGDKANISVEIVNEIPELASGKRKYIVSEI